MDELLQLESAGWDSLCDGSGGAFYGALMTDDAVMVLANGDVMDRDTVVESLDHAPPWASYSIDDPRAIPIGPTTTALVYRGTGHRDDGSSFTGVMTSVYVESADGRRLALYQQTPIPQRS